MKVPDPYMPILAGRAGELDALKHAGLSAADGVSPLFDFAPVRRSLPTGDGPPKVADAAGALRRQIDRIASIWGTDQRVLIDIEGYSKFHSPGGLHAVEFLAELVRERGLRATIVVSTTASAGYRAAVAAQREVWKGVAFRLVAPDGEGDSRALELATELEVPAVVSDLLVDLGRISSADAALHRLSGLTIGGPLRERWGNVALASTPLPDFSQLKSPVDGRPYRRIDRAVWSEFREAIGSAVVFSDYGVTGPRIDTDQPVGGPAPHLRYTALDDFWIWRGRKPQEGGGQEGVGYADLCDSLAKIRNRRGLSVYRGGRFSWGDSRIEQTIRERTPGAPRSWIANSTSHHLRQVCHELAR